MIDTHCHLWFDQFKDEIPAVIGRAKNAGVHTLICVGCNEESSKQSVEIAGQYENVYAAVGVHPTETFRERGFAPLAGSPHNGFASLRAPQDPKLATFLYSFDWIRELFRSSKKIIGIGETGLDYFHQPFDRELQMAAFREQCLIAKEHDLPVMVHLRSSKESKVFSKDLTAAEKDCLTVLDETAMPSGKVLFHCFSGDRTMAEEVLKRGWYLSFSGVITFPRAEELREVVRICPLDRMVVETDSPFLTPKSHRGQRNEPAYVVETARKIAEIKNLSYEVLEQALDQNVKKLFSL